MHLKFFPTQILQIKELLKKLLFVYYMVFFPNIVFQKFSVKVLGRSFCWILFHAKQTIGECLFFW